MNIGAKIKGYRKQNNLSQKELAEMLEISDKTISSWEVNRTEPSVLKLKQICRALNVKMPDLIGDDEFIDYEYFYTDNSNSQLKDESTQPVVDALGNPGMRLRLIDYAKYLISEFNK